MPEGFGNNLGERVKRSNRDVAERRRDNRDQWGWTGGNYGDYGVYAVEQLGKAFRVYERESQADLLGAEVVIYHDLTRKLNDPAIQKPIVALDFGGTSGLSFIRIANRFEQERQAISRGELVMIVSNLVGFQSDADDHSKSSLNKDALAFFNEKHHLVQYVVANAKELAKSTTFRLGDVNLPIRGNASLIHEQSALHHSYIPDVDLQLLSRCLSPHDGVMMVSYKITNQKTSPDMRASIDEAAEIGLANLARRPNFHEQILDPNKYPLYRIFLTGNHNLSLDGPLEIRDSVDDIESSIQ